MTIRHMVLFRLNADVAQDDPRVHRAVAASGGLGASVPGGEDWTIGRDLSGRDVAADFAGVGDFATTDVLRAFLAHPGHRAAADLWSLIATWTVADIALPDDVAEH